jgi:hypothetical protein
VRGEDGDVAQSDDEDEKISRENFTRKFWSEKMCAMGEKIKLLSNKISVKDEINMKIL